MFGSSYRIMTIWGIPIKIHISLIALLVVVGLYMILSEGAMALALLLYLLVAIFTSVALHELGHSLVAIRKGCRVREITLMFIGGAAQMDEVPSRPRDEFQMAVAGPAVSIVLGLLSWFVGGALPLEDSLLPVPFFGVLVPCNIAQLPGLINFGLAGFNLLPAFPMDGGRVLRALLTRKLGRLRATFIAARLGKILAILFGVHSFLSGNLVLAAIAFFVYTLAGKEYSMVEMQERARRGVSCPPRFGEWVTDDADEDEVIVSPPPYKDAPDAKASVRPSRKPNPFGGLFGKD